MVPPVHQWPAEASVGVTSGDPGSSGPAPAAPAGLRLAPEVTPFPVWKAARLAGDPNPEVTIVAWAQGHGRIVKRSPSRPAPPDLDLPAEAPILESGPIAREMAIPAPVVSSEHAAALAELRALIEAQEPSP